jgi:sarcosine oxidase
LSNHEIIVVGCGGLGSAALYWLSREFGGSVLGIERFELGHARPGELLTSPVTSD